MFSAERMAGQMCVENWKGMKKCWRKKEMQRVSLNLCISPRHFRGKSFKVAFIRNEKV